MIREMQIIENLQLLGHPYLLAPTQEPEAMFQTNPSLDIASQPNEAPDSAHESRNQLLFIYSF